MSTPLYIDSQLYLANMIGTWAPNSTEPLPENAFREIQQAATDATRHALGLTGPILGFHIVYREQEGGPVVRTRWRVEAHVSGPALRTGGTGSYETDVALYFRVHAHTELTQVISDPPDAEMPYRGVLGDVVPALLLASRWGNGPRTLTLDGFGSGVFTPETMRFSSLWGQQIVNVPYPSPIGDYSSYPLVSAPSANAPGLWLFDESGAGGPWKLSYCVSRTEEGRSARWDEPEGSAPEFVAVDWTA